MAPTRPLPTSTSIQYTTYTINTKPYKGPLAEAREKAAGEAAKKKAAEEALAAARKKEEEKDKARFEKWYEEKKAEEEKEKGMLVKKPWLDPKKHPIYKAPLREQVGKVWPQPLGGDLVVDWINDLPGCVVYCILAYKSWRDYTAVTMKGFCTGFDHPFYYDGGLTKSIQCANKMCTRNAYGGETLSEILPRWTKEKCLGVSF